MFDIGWTELLVIAVVAIVVIGPKDLPRAMRTVGQWTGRVKRMAGDFQRQFNEAIREAELDDVKKQVDKIGRIDPMADLRKTLTTTEAGLKNDLKKVDDGIKAGLDKPDAVNPTPKTPPAAEVASTPPAPVPPPELAAPEAVAVPPPVAAAEEAKP
jgi:sec-independent protein translocase protein TatB